MFDIEIVHIMKDRLDLVRGWCGVFIRNWAWNGLRDFNFGHCRGNFCGILAASLELANESTICYAREQNGGLDRCATVKVEDLFVKRSEVWRPSVKQALPPETTLLRDCPTVDLLGEGLMINSLRP
jgi:hypothetical protein